MSMRNNPPKKVVAVSSMLNCGDCYPVYLVKFEDETMGIYYNYVSERCRSGDGWTNGLKLGDTITDYETLDGAFEADRDE
jgi:hypothetical protein